MMAFQRIDLDAYIMPIYCRNKSPPSATYARMCLLSAGKFCF